METFSQRLTSCHDVPGCYPLIATGVHNINCATLFSPVSLVHWIVSSKPSGCHHVLRPGVDGQLNHVRVLPHGHEVLIFAVVDLLSDTIEKAIGESMMFETYIDVSSVRLHDVIEGATQVEIGR